MCSGVVFLVRGHLSYSRFPVCTHRLTGLGWELLVLALAQLLVLGRHSVNVCSVSEGGNEGRDCNFFITLLPPTMSVILARTW